MFGDSSGSEIREVYHQTRVVRRPTYGIVRGYHELPYVCLGESDAPGHETTEIRGKVMVSPRFIVRPTHCEPSYEEVFGEGNVDTALAGRVFGFLGFRGRPVECSSDHLEVKHRAGSVDRVLSETLDALERHEDITTGVIITPDSRYYPVSVERFITSVLNDEFSV